MKHTKVLQEQWQISGGDLAQLRHLYYILVNKQTNNLEELANGLLAPVIRNIERGN